MSESRGDVDVRVGARVKAARLAAHVSQSKLGASLGLTFQQVQKYEKGSSRLSIAALQRIAETLGVPASIFLDPEHRNIPTAEAQDAATEQAEIAEALTLLRQPELRRSILAVAKLVSGPAN